MFSERFKCCISLFLTISLLSGCMITKGYLPDAPVTVFEPIPAVVNMSINLTHTFDGKHTDGSHNKSRVETMQKISQDIMTEANVFKSMGYDILAPDLFLTFEITEKEKGSSANATISGLTLLLVPAKSGMVFEVKAHLKDNQGNTVGIYESKGDFNVILHLLFIIPIGWRFGVLDEVFKSVFRDIAAKLNADRTRIIESLG